jgi:hypothetical protein
VKERNLSGEMGTRRSREDSEIVEVMSHGEREREREFEDTFGICVI